MAKKKKHSDRFADLTWEDIEEWVGNKILSRGRSYQRQGLVSDLALMDDGDLIAWVDGTERYATRVSVDKDGLPDSVCTCPYEFDCKHAVAVVIEYLQQIENNRQVPKAKQNDKRLALLEDNDWDDEPSAEAAILFEDVQKEIERFLKPKTKAQLVELVCELAKQYPEIKQNLMERRQLASGDIKTLTANLRREIHEVGNETGWQNYWRDEGYTPDYSGIRKKLETLLAAGHADEVLALGRDLVTTSMRQVEESNDEGETAMEIADCMPVIVNALEQSSLDPVDKLKWAIDAVLDDQFDICEAFGEYLFRQHPKSAWHELANRLLDRLKRMKVTKSSTQFSSDYDRNRVSDWIIHAMERSGRQNEIIPLCESEAKKTGSYDRLVKRLIATRRYKDAEFWIHSGIKATKNKWPGIASQLRDKLSEIRKAEKNWPSVAAMQAERFVRSPSQATFADCHKAADKVKVWAEVRGYLLDYLEKGTLPWKQKGWPLPQTGLDAPGPERKDRFPMVETLIRVAILEKKPDQVLYWYDRLSQKRFGGYWVNDDEIASAIQNHAPERAVGIWQHKAEGLIAQVKPSAYQEAAKYLRKAKAVATRLKKQEQWDRYLNDLRETHARKSRLMEILDGLDGKPIVKKKR